MFPFARMNKPSRKSIRQIQPPRLLFLERLEDRTLLSVHFFDNFEEASLNPFWSTVTQSGSITFPSTAQAHSGTQSVQFNSTYNTGQKDIELFHTFSTPIFGDVSVWLYDTGANFSSSNYQIFALWNASLSMRSDILTQDYNLGPGNGGDVYYYRNWVDANQQPNRSSISRTQGWHHFEINTTALIETITIDGITVFSGTGGTPFGEISLGMSGPTWRPAWVTYWDVFSLNAATHFSVSAPTSTTAGAPFSITVSALDANNDTDTSYTRTVHFTTSDSGSGVVLPFDYTFTAADQGVHTFTGVTLATPGSQTITATDTGMNSITGTATVTVNPAVTNSLEVSGFPSPTMAGVAQSFTVTALDPFGNVVTGYTGTVHFTSTDSKAALPANYTFTASDAGMHIFSATLKTAGTRAITATDTTTMTITGSESGIIVDPAAASQLKVSAPTSSIAGKAFSITVTALDPFGNTATGYTGTVHFTSSDNKAALPADYIFIGGDGGAHVFSHSVALVTAGSQTVTAIDTVTASITGKSSAIKVSPAAVDHLKVTGPASSTAGVAFGITITAQDAFNNTVTGYTGTVHFTSSDALALLPADYPFTGTNKGAHTFTNGVTPKTAGTQSITATDTATATVKGSTSLTVKPGKASSLSITAPSSVTQGVAFTFTVTALDVYGNVATGYTGNVHFSSSDAVASLPVNFTFLSIDGGLETFSCILNTSGSQTLTATDTVTPTITGTDPAIQVTAGAGAQRAANATIRMNGYNRLSVYSPSWQLPSGFAGNADLSLSLPYQGKAMEGFWANLSMDTITHLASGETIN